MVISGSSKPTNLKRPEFSGQAAQRRFFADLTFEIDLNGRYLSKLSLEPPRIPHRPLRKPVKLPDSLRVTCFRTLDSACGIPSSDIPSLMLNLKGALIEDPRLPECEPNALVPPLHVRPWVTGFNAQHGSYNWMDADQVTRPGESLDLESIRGFISTRVYWFSNYGSWTRSFWMLALGYEFPSSGSWTQVRREWVYFAVNVCVGTRGIVDLSYGVWQEALEVSERSFDLLGPFDSISSVWSALSIGVSALRLVRGNSERSN